MGRRKITLQTMSDVGQMEGRHSFPNTHESKFGSALVGYVNLRAGLFAALEHERFVKAHKAASATAPALWLEFGVYRGTSINATAVYRDELVARLGTDPITIRLVGLDSFEGLPEAWGVMHHRLGVKGAFSWKGEYSQQEGALPPTRRGVELAVGLFDQTLSGILARWPNSTVMHVNVDNDLYAGALYALETLAPRLRRGSRIHFHEILSGWFRLGSHGKNRVWRFDARYDVADEAKALYEWLLKRPCAALSLVPECQTPVFSPSAVFIVRQLHCTGRAP